MSEHRYPVGVLLGDYARAGAGLSLTLTPLLLIDLAGPMVVIFGGFAALFAWFGARTGLRQASRLEISPDAVALLGPQTRRLPWPELERVKLAYYAPRRQRDGGWLQLTLRGSGRRPIRVDSTIEGFDLVLQQTQAAVDARGIELDPVTASNFAALGLPPRGYEELPGPSAATAAATSPAGGMHRF